MSEQGDGRLSPLRGRESPPSVGLCAEGSEPHQALNGAFGLLWSRVWSPSSAAAEMGICLADEVFYTNSG